MSMQDEMSADLYDQGLDIHKVLYGREADSFREANEAGLLSKAWKPNRSVVT